MLRNNQNQLDPNEERRHRVGEARARSQAIKEEWDTMTQEERADYIEATNQRVAQGMAEEQHRVEAARAQQRAAEREADIRDKIDPRYSREWLRWHAANPNYNEHYFASTAWPALRQELYVQLQENVREAYAATVRERLERDGLSI